jgi:hypothetical protein
MIKRIKSILFVICVVMVFTAQTNRPEEGKQHAPAAGPAPAARPAPVSRNNQSRPQVQTYREAPQQVVHQAPSTARAHISPSAHQERAAAPRVYAVPAPKPVENNRLFHRQHHNNRQPLYNFYDNRYQFYPYVNVASLVELSADCVAVLFNGQTYYYDRGSFYVQDPQGYLATPPPIGIIVSVIPQHARQIDVNGQIYYRYKGVFYIQVAQGYQVVGPVQSPSDDS